MPTAAPASTAAVANELVALCRAGRNLDALAKLYSPKVVSIEPVDSEAIPAEMTGIDAVRQKNEWWFRNNEVNSYEVNGPFVGGDQFAVQYLLDTTFKPTGQRSASTEMALYTPGGGLAAAFPAGRLTPSRRSASPSSRRGLGPAHRAYRSAPRK